MADQDGAHPLMAQQLWLALNRHGDNPRANGVDVAQEGLNRRDRRAIAGLVEEFIKQVDA